MIFKMINKFYRIIFFLLVVLVVSWMAFPASAAPGEESIPSGFELVRDADSVALYKKNYANGSPDYVQVADLNLGAQVHVLHGKIVEAGEGEGVYGGDNARFARKSIQQFWQTLNSSADDAFCVTNGQFFRLADSPTPLPFPLKTDGEILSDGYGIKEFPDQKLMLEIWPDHLDIRELTKENLYSSSAPDIVAGLTEDAEKASKKAVGRTFIGIADRDGDRRFDNLYIFTTQIARPSDAAETLRAFGAEKVMMLDGGGSTQLVCQQDVLINTDRLIPQAIGISAGQLPALAASLSPENEIPVVISGETLATTLVIYNKGSTAWQPVNTQFFLNREDGHQVAALSLPAEILPGEQVSIEWLIPPVDQSGLQEVQLSLSANGNVFPVQAGKLEWISLPADLSDKQTELVNQLRAWSGNPEIDLAAEFQSWLKTQQSQSVAMVEQDIQSAEPLYNAGLSNNLGARVNIGDAAWIPLLMIPLVTIMIAVIRRIQQFQT